MINPVQTTIPQPDGSDRYVIIEPVLVKDAEGHWSATGIFKIYKDAFADQTHLFTEEHASDEEPELPDAQNPDYLGKFVFEGASLKRFEGQVLSLAEQAYLAVFIETYEEPDI